MKIASAVYYFALHVKGAGAFPPPLSAEREAELLEKSRNGDDDARNELIEHNLRLVAHIVKKYYNTGAAQDDMISIGTIGLIRAYTLPHTPRAVLKTKYLCSSATRKKPRRMFL